MKQRERARKDAFITALKRILLRGGVQCVAAEVVTMTGMHYWKVKHFDLSGVIRTTQVSEPGDLYADPERIASAILNLEKRRHDGIF